MNYDRKPRRQCRIGDVKRQGREKREQERFVDFTEISVLGVGTSRLVKPK